MSDLLQYAIVLPHDFTHFIRPRTKKVNNWSHKKVVQISIAVGLKKRKKCRETPSPRFIMRKNPTIQKLDGRVPVADLFYLALHAIEIGLPFCNKVLYR